MVPPARGCTCVVPHMSQLSLVDPKLLLRAHTMPAAFMFAFNFSDFFVSVLQLERLKTAR